MGVWIETSKYKGIVNAAESLPTWECGLKPLVRVDPNTSSHVTPHVGVWIETAQPSLTQIGH